MADFIQKCRELGFKELHEFPSDFKKEVVDYIKNKYNVDICIGINLRFFRPSFTIREKIDDKFIPRMIITHPLLFDCKYYAQYMRIEFPEEYRCFTQYGLTEFEKIRNVYEDLVKIELKSNELINSVLKECIEYSLIPFLTQNLTYVYSIIEYYLNKNLSNDFINFLKCYFSLTKPFPLKKLITIYAENAYNRVTSSVTGIDSILHIYGEYIEEIDVDSLISLIHGLVMYLDGNFMIFTFFPLFSIFEKEFGIDFNEFIKKLSQHEIIYHRITPYLARTMKLSEEDTMLIKELYNMYKLIEQGVNICEFLSRVIEVIEKYVRSVIQFELNLYTLLKQLTYFSPTKLHKISYEMCKDVLICEECYYLDC